MALALATKIAVMAAFAGPLAAAPFLAGPVTNKSEPAPAVIEIAAGAFVYRASGEFTRSGRPVMAPTIAVALAQPVAIMTHQVSAADFQRCVDADACRPLAAGVVATDRPVVQVSWRDAENYAAWLSTMTDERWRLPSDEEWAFAAGSRWRDDAVAIDADDPSRRSLARYEQEANLRDPADDGATRPFGGFGANEHGILDFAGNVWEWTSTCYVRTALGDDGAVVSATKNCGVRVVEGRHRAYVTDFVRDARGGGCSAGVPPTHLGFRLVRERPSWRTWVMAKWEAWRVE
jgi:formylglycine-generating enzyme required for sulfatase activity